jgi:peptidoglycan/xylan/chitin deacetylase (PgdA/CDA1 family)
MQNGKYNSMKKYIRDICIRIMQYSGAAYVYRHFFVKNPLVRVLVFHDVQNAEWFEDILALCTATYNVLTPEAFLAQKFDFTKVNVLFTFDDGYTSWIEVVEPLLRKYNTHAVFFINSGLLDVHHDPALQSQFVRERLLLSPRKTLSWEGAQLLQREGHMIGGHTATHARFSRLQKDMQEKEIKVDRERIEEMIQVVPSLFAYAFGQEADFAHDGEESVRHAGYRYAYATVPGFVSFKNAYAVPRLCLEETLTRSEIRAWIEGGYDLYYRIKKLCVR